MTPSDGSSALRIIQQKHPTFSGRILKALERSVFPRKTILQSFSRLNFKQLHTASSRSLYLTEHHSLGVHALSESWLPSSPSRRISEISVWIYCLSSGLIRLGTECSSQMGWTHRVLHIYPISPPASPCPKVYTCFQQRKVCFSLLAVFRAPVTNVKAISETSIKNAASLLL